MQSFAGGNVPQPERGVQGGGEESELVVCPLNARHSIGMSLPLQ